MQRIALIIGLWALCAPMKAADGASAVVLPLPDGDDGAIAIPWIAADQTDWRSGPTTFSIDGEAEASSLSAEGRIGVDAEGIHMLITVRDDQHGNHRSGSTIWDGDALQIGIDTLPAWDPGSRLPQPLPHRASITVALLVDGPAAWAHHHDQPGHVGAVDARMKKLHITRDEAAAITTYDLCFPWSEFAQQPGAVAALGVAVQVNDTDGDQPQHRLYWGHGAGGRLQAERFMRLRISDIPQGTVGIEVATPEIWRTDGAACIRLGIADIKAARIRVDCAGRQTEVRLTKAAIRSEYAVLVRPEAWDLAAATVQVDVLTEDGSVLASAKGLITNGLAVVDHAIRHLEATAARAEHPQHKRHLRALRALVLGEAARGDVLLDEDAQQIRIVAAAARKIVAAANDERWEIYQERRRRLVFLTRSNGDGSVQPNLLTLPKDWDPTRQYPLIVWLHGAGRTYHPLDYAVDAYDPMNSDGGEEETAFILQPYARGNHGYSAMGELDVWEAMAEVERQYRIDPDRRYLTGFSMGGGGAWALGLRSPDTWAAICVYAGVRRFITTGQGIGMNARGLPVAIYHGMEDRAVPIADSRIMMSELRQHGVDPVVEFVPGVGHEILPESRRRLNAWLLSQRRQRPREFGFMADSDLHLGRNGIRLVRDASREPFPSFHCRIDGNQVFIQSQGTPGLHIDLGENGLGLVGDVGVEWNGYEVYRGPAQSICLFEADTTEPKR